MKEEKWERRQYKERERNKRKIGMKVIQIRMKEADLRLQHIFILQKTRCDVNPPLFPHGCKHSLQVNSLINSLHS